MKATFIENKAGTWAYIQKSVRVNGKSTTYTVKKLGLLADIQQREGCEDPRQWVLDLAAKMTREEKEGKLPVVLELDPSKSIETGQKPLRHGGDLMLIPLYNKLGLPTICSRIAKGSRIKYDLNEILRTLVTSRLLFPSSKTRTFDLAKGMIYPPEFGEHDMYRALSLLSGHIDDIQAYVYANSCKVMERRTRVIYYDCSNYYFEIEDNDKDYVDTMTGEVIPGLRKRGKSKEHRPNPIVQMGLFMDMDGIPLAFVIFPGNESEQTSLQPLERVLDSKFGLTDFIVSTDSGLGSEDNRRYNMAEGRDYICVQSLPSLKAGDQAMALAPDGWHLSYCPSESHRKEIIDNCMAEGVFNLDAVLEYAEEYNAQNKSRIRNKIEKPLLHGTTFYKEIIVGKEQKYINPEWLRLEKENPGAKHTDAKGKRVPKELKSVRQERVIVTYSNDYALYLRHKRAERLRISQKMVDSKQTKPRQSQQSPHKYIATTYFTESGEEAAKVEMAIDQDAVNQEERFDGFYGYATSLDDDAIDVLRARSFHPEIEHLFRTTKTFLDARPVYLSRQDRIKSHFLICFLAMTILKMLQRQLTEANPEAYREEPLTIDSLIETLQNYRFGIARKGKKEVGYMPMYTRTALTDQLQTLIGVTLDKEVIKKEKMDTIHSELMKVKA